MVILLAMYSEGNIWLWYHSVSKTFFSCFTNTYFWHGSDLDHVTQLFWTISSQLYVNSTCNIKLKLFNITWFDLAQYVQRCPRMFRCWQQITHPFSFSSFVCVSVRPPACLHICVILFLYRFVCFLSVHSSVRSFVRLIVFCQYECMHVSLLSVYMTVTYPISNLLLLASYF